MTGSRTLIVGVGSPHGDDQVGWKVAEALMGDRSADVEIRAARSPGELLHWLGGVDELIVCDACRGEAPAGTIRRWSWPAAELERVNWSGTHDLGLCSVLELADQLGRLPDRVTLWSVQAASFHQTPRMSADVAAAIENVVEEIRRQLLGCTGQAAFRSRS